MSEIKEKRTHFISQEALDERKELLGLIKGQERDINECEKNIGYQKTILYTLIGTFQKKEEQMLIGVNVRFQQFVIFDRFVGGFRYG